MLQPEIGPDGEKVTGYQALSFASLSESFYAALSEDPCNESLLLTLSSPLQGSEFQDAAGDHQVPREFA